MYRLLIVDDEEIIVNGLYEIFCSLKELDLDVYKAYSGEEAIDWLRRTRIDIVLSDINMPEIDGLQLLEEIQRSWPQCKVVFLTGHSEFSYVYTAIQKPGVKYILKTEEYEKIISSVEESIEEIRRDIKTEDMISKAKEQMNMARDLFQRDFFTHLLNGDINVSSNDKQLEELETTMKSDWPVYLVLGHIDNLPKNLSYRSSLEQIYSVRQIMSRYLTAYVNSTIVLSENYQYVIFIQPRESLFADFAPEDTEAYYRKTSSFIRGTLESIQRTCLEKLELSISFAVSGIARGWTDISQAYKSLVQLINFRIGDGLDSILIDDAVGGNAISKDSGDKNMSHNEETEALEHQLRHRNLNVLERYLESGQQDEYFQLLKTIIDPLKVIESKNNPVAMEAYFTVSLTIQSIVNRWKLTEKAAFHIGQNKLMRTDFFETWSEAVSYLWDFSKLLFELQEEEKNKRADNTILFLQQFIEEHLDEDLSLVKLAEQVYLNPSYLSRLYKQFTGNNLSEFIDSARARRAKKLLMDNQIRIHEVACMVGYETAASFSRFFKKVAGISPQEFRENEICKHLCAR